MQNKRKSKAMWIGKEFMDQGRISEVKDLFGNVEIQSTILKEEVKTPEDLAKILETIKDYNIIIIQKTSFKKTILARLLELNKEKIKKVFCAFCPLKRRSTRKKLVIISNADREKFYGQIEI